jgi:MFS family permease
VKKRYGVLGFLIALSVLTFLDRLAIAVAGPRIQDELHIPPDLWGWVLGAFALAYGVFEMPSGSSGDRLGQRRVLTRIVIWWSAFAALTGLVRSFVQLIVTQFFFGAGEAGAYPNASGVIARWFPKRERARAQGAVWAASRVGGALSPLLVVPLLHAIGWRAMFCLFASFGLFWAVFWRRWYHDDPARQPGIGNEELKEIDLARRPAHGREVWQALVHNRQAWLLAGMYCCYAWASWFYFSWFPTFLVRGAHFTEKEMGLYSSLPFVFGCTGNLAGGLISDRLTARRGLRTGRCLLASACLAVSSMLLLGLAFAHSKTAVVILASAGFGVLDLMLPATWSLCLDLGRAHAGVLTGSMNTAGLAGGFVCSVLFGYLVRRTGGYSAPLCVIAGMVLLSSLLYLLIDPRRPVWSEESAG